MSVCVRDCVGHGVCMCVYVCVRVCVALCTCVCVIIVGQISAQDESDTFNCYELPLLVNNVYFF